MIASYSPQKRSEAIDTIQKFLIPGAQKTKNGGGLLPAIGITLDAHRLNVKAKVLPPVPVLMAAGVPVPPHKAENWGPLLGNAKFNLNPRDATRLNVVVFVNKRIKNSVNDVFGRIKTLVNNFQ